MSNSARQLQWPMDDEGTYEVVDLFLLLRKFLEEPPVLLRLQCRAFRSQQMDINTEIQSEIRDGLEGSRDAWDRRWRVRRMFQFDSQKTRVISSR